MHSGFSCTEGKLLTREVYAMTNTIRCLKRLAALAVLGGALVLLLQASALPANARADECYPEGGWTTCTWAHGSLSPGVRRYFSAPGGNNSRNWWFAGVGDGHGGSVANKCVGIMRASDGLSYDVHCGPGANGQYTSGHYRPGYLYIWHSAPGARYIFGWGRH